MFVGYYLAGQVYSTQAAFFAWANVVCRADDEERAIVLASMNLLRYTRVHPRQLLVLWIAVDDSSNAVNAWWSIGNY